MKIMNFINLPENLLVIANPHFAVNYVLGFKGVCAYYVRVFLVFTLI
ncbi:unnamed protein product [Acanthoscelides obtectus]|uniref:Uncharacterized protein n=1 Tax=Acanthoscelides obtectus TaxID=200917 RepID=A0A9P0PIE7_ACAOB|nr:unnamed protein product [Acanthoscelides obtectus]CAK1680965.1 hypothetical protein AOBTE_LOCUS32960 [Acanthoscelides obtectus]